MAVESLDCFDLIHFGFPFPKMLCLTQIVPRWMGDATLKQKNFGEWQI